MKKINFMLDINLYVNVLLKNFNISKKKILLIVIAISLAIGLCYFCYINWNLIKNNWCIIAASLLLFSNFLLIFKFLRIRKNGIKYKKDFCDKRNGRTYKTVKIGKQIWLAENLKYILGSDKFSSFEIGKPYNWEQAKKACPPGWHLPTKEEWLELIEFAGGIANAGKKLKAKKDWDSSGTDDYGFAALPYSKSGSLNHCSWWGASENNSNAFFVAIESDSSINTGYVGKASCAKYIRCVKDGLVRAFLNYASEKETPPLGADYNPQNSR